MAGRLRTIRGSMIVDANARPQEKLIFNYESADRTRGWIIEDAWIWISTVNTAQPLTSDVNLSVIANLATDEIAGGLPLVFNTITDCDDNRQIAWHQKQWLGKDTNDFYMPTASPGLTGCDFLIDEERIVTNQLFITAGYLQSGGGDILATKLNFLVNLREVSISPSQSLMQQLKGIGQDISN